MVQVDEPALREGLPLKPLKKEGESIALWAEMSGVCGSVLLVVAVGLSMVDQHCFAGSANWCRLTSALGVEP